MGATDVFKAVGKVAFPFLTMAAQAGGPFTAMAAEQIGKRLGLTPAPADAQAIAKVMEQATGNAEQRAAMQQAEHEFQIQIEQLTNGKIKNAQDFEAHLAELDTQDRASARDRETKVRDNTNKVLAYFIVLLAGLVTAVVITGHAAAMKDATTAALAGTIVGYIFGEVKAVYNYYFGSSRGQDRQTELLAQADSIDNPK